LSPKEVWEYDATAFEFQPIPPSQINFGNLDRGTVDESASSPFDASWELHHEHHQTAQRHRLTIGGWEWFFCTVRSKTASDLL
jgi:hypothetical protein